MTYDNTSMIGDEICEYYYDMENNFMNPPSPTGFFIYHLLGDCFDRLDEKIRDFRTDMSILTCNVGRVEIPLQFPSTPDKEKTYYVPMSSGLDTPVYTKYEYIEERGGWVIDYEIGTVQNCLDTFWGHSYSIERPVIWYGPHDSRVFSDEEYRIYLYLKRHQLITKKDLKEAFTNCFGGVEITTRIVDAFKVVDHKSYDNPSFTNKTLKSYDPEDKDIITDKLVDNEEVKLVTDKKTKGDLVIIIPDNGWDDEFISTIETITTLKANVNIIQEEI